MWWPYMWGYDEKKVTNEIKETVDLGLPLMVGEFADKWEETANGAIPYKTILEQCYLNEIGYLVWSWGPGNNPQTFLDMTTDGKFDTLRDWAKEICITNPYSIKNIAIRPASMLTDPPERPVASIPEGSISLNKPVFASSTEAGSNLPENAVDGNLGTRWSSEYSEPQYIYVDLQNEYEIGRVYIEWETAYTRQYRIQVSNDASTWTDVHTEYNGDGDIDDIKLSAKGRYVRLYCMQRATSWGNSLFEFAVYEKGGTTPSSTPPKALRGDINGDGKVNAGDYTLLRRIILEAVIPTKLEAEAADIDGDGRISAGDYTLLRRYILGIILGLF
jgi:mannan endo-1,4-beta-mannosidase